MAQGFSAYLQNYLIDTTFRAGTAWTTPSNLYICLLTTACVNTDTGTTISAGGGTGVEVTGGSYARVEYDPIATNWDDTQQDGTSAASSGSTGITRNNIAITFPTATADWGTIVGVCICDDATAGNMLFYGTLANPTIINNGAIFIFNPDQLQIKLDCS